MHHWSFKLRWDGVSALSESVVERVALRYDSAPARRRAILDEVERAGFVSVTDLTRMLGVSDMTVRRDLRKLQHQGRVRVVHGGVSALAGPVFSPAFAGRAGLEANAKRRIGQAAIGLIPDGATVAVDAGTTAFSAVQALPESFHGSVVTHSIPVMQLLLSRGAVRVVGLGGELLSSSQAFVGPRTVEATKDLRAQTLLLGCAAVDANGLYVASDNERPTKLALMDIADQVVLLADSTKFRASAPVRLCGWERVSSVVTNSTLSDDLQRRLDELRVTVHIALDHEEQTTSANP
jgi:DeoR family transcriptional regulator, fructose operon transcriptional repressor